MQLAAVAEKLVHEVRKLIDEEIIIIDHAGTIIASTDGSRIGSYHEGAIHAFNNREKLIINKQDERSWKGVKAGINLPIFFNQEAVCVIGITGDPKHVSPYAELLKKMTEMFIQESYHIEQAESQSRLMEFFVFEWHQLQMFNEPFLQKAKLLGVDVHADRIITLGEFKTEKIIEPHVWRTLQMYIKQQHPKDIVVRWGRNQFVILSIADFIGSKIQQLKKLSKLIRNLEESSGFKVSAGVSSRAPGSAFRQAFFKAERSLKIALPSSEIIFDEDLKLEVLLDEVTPETRHDYLSRTIQDLLPNEELLKTLSMYFASDLSLKETAAALHIHINTLHYRLKRIEEMTQLNPRKLADLVTMYLALRVLDKHTN
ncbi:sugar diacid recognition domain-containing protein [Peribacillus sp. ACCC06369]|uniref:PucR family transcriptional regulator n=1 Tax=Peribacillus sp. ACCC06369 TaxID=3055860 RepID=UPI0025A130B8|nr:sugar diacid recognition domain-containing protein [Peribacillus sp. ACCC06369]MDM5360028.1 sugar diacid recognition domain-containing protein [Peribacillus sp. ACCC06369]